jgi:hypothetical protein
MLEVFAGKVRKTGFFQKAGFPGNPDNNFGIHYNREHRTREETPHSRASLLSISLDLQGAPLLP